MSKVVKAVAIGAVIGLGGFYLLPALGMATPFAGQTILGLSGAWGAAAGTAIYAGLGAIATHFLVKKPPNVQTAQERLRLSIDPQAQGKWIFGETACATDIVYAEQHGENDEVDVITHVVAAAAHTITSFESLYVNDEEITFSGNAATGDWADTLWRATRTGTESQTAIGTIVSGDGLSWPSDAEGAGIAHYMLRWKTGQEKTKSGIPTRITQIVKGMPVYDPRLDSTVGGVGSHRADDQSTWEYTYGGRDIGANWALIVLAYIIGWRNNGELIFGIGADLNDIDYAQAMAAANVCEETVDGKPRYRIGGVITTDNDHSNVISQLEAAIGGSVSFIGGKYYIWAPNDDLTSYDEITDDDIIRESGIEFVPSGPLEDLYNTARGRYVSPDDLYQLVNYPEVVESSAVTSDGRSRVMSMDFPYIQDVSIAERVAREQVRRTRFSGTWRMTVGPKGFIWKPFDVTTLNCQETNNTDVVVRIVNMVFSARGVVQLEMVEEDESIYDTSLPLGTPVTQNDPSSFDPATKVPVTGVTATPFTINGSAGTSRIAYLIGWDFPGLFVARTELRYRPTAVGSEWIYLGPAAVNGTGAVIQDYEPLTEYEVQLRHVTLYDVASDWVGFTGTTADVGLTHYDDIVHYYYQSSPPSGQGEKNNDIWVDSDDNKPYRRVAGVWVEIQDDGIDQAVVDAAEAMAAATGKIEFIFSDTAPGSPELGQYWFDTDDGDHPYRWNGSMWVDAENDIIAQALLDALEATGDAATAQATADSKIVTFVGDDPPVADGFGDIWLETDNNNALYRWNGSAWVQYLQDEIGRDHAAETGNPHGATLNQITSLMSAAGSTVRSGIGNDYEIEQGSSYIYLKHKDADPSSTLGSYSGTLRTAVALTATGISLGYNRTSDGAWVDAIVLDSIGDAYYYGNLVTAGTVYAYGITSAAAFGVNAAMVAQGASDPLATASSRNGFYANADHGSALVAQAFETDGLALEALNLSAGTAVQAYANGGTGLKCSGHLFGSNSGIALQANGYTYLNNGAEVTRAHSTLPTLKVTGNSTGPTLQLAGNAEVSGFAYFLNTINFMSDIDVHGYARLEATSAGSRTSGEVKLSAVNSTLGNATLNITSWQSVEGAGTVNITHQLRVNINGAEYIWYLEAV